MKVTLIGHGSLMSGRGLAFSGTFQIYDACIVALNNCKRGFAKLSKYGDRFATDLEIASLPLEGEIVSCETKPDGRVEALGLTVTLEDFGRLVKREGYQPASMYRLVERARENRLGVAEWLWNLDAQNGHDLVAYRRQLFAITGYTSPHYIPHPVRLNGTDYALIFLAPGFEGTGSPDVVSVREQTGIENILTTAETWRRKPNDDQIAYFLSCLLGGAHGICVQDFLSTIADETDLAGQLYQRLRPVQPVLPVLAEEVACFLETTGLTQQQYQRAFGRPEAALRRSGLQGFLDGFDDR